MNTKAQPLIYLTRVEQFSSAHCLCNKSLSDEENQTIFGKCNNVHGHNYKLEVTVKGVINSNGMVINITDLKAIIEQHVLQKLDHKNIDNDVNYFRINNIVSTSENVCVFIWNQISEHLPSDVQLHCIKLHETEKNIVEFYGQCLTK